MSWPNLENVAYPWLAGAVGAVVGLKFVVGATWPERAANVAAGTAVAVFVAPAVADYYTLSSAVTGGLSFTFGLFGVAVAGAVFGAIRSLDLAELVRGWISRR